MRKDRHGDTSAVSTALKILSIVVLLALMVPAGLWLGTSLKGAPEAPEEPSTPAWQLPPTAAATATALDPQAPVPSPERLTPLLVQALRAQGSGSFTGVVLDAGSGEQLFDKGASQPRIPASNLKLLTAAAALETLGPDSRLRTTVHQSAPDKLVLSGGGDVLLGEGESDTDSVLGHAGLRSLARATIKALQSAGATGKFTVAADTTIFSGPTLNPAVDRGDVKAGETAPVFPMALNSARFTATDTAADRPQNPAAEVLAAFTTALNTEAGQSGVVLSFTSSGTAAAAPTAPELAGVDSASVADQVGFMLSESDNFLTEVFARLIARKAGQPGSYQAGVAAVLAHTKALGLDTSTLKLADVAGLSLANRISARQLAQILVLMSDPARPKLSRALSGLPIAGLSGTLGGRYQDAASRAGAGLVRAKTGTLNTVLGLSGYVIDADGRLLVFSFIGNDLKPGAAGNKAALDRAASVLAGCGCR